jgi:histidyl-tRNA synthetase
MGASFQAVRGMNDLLPAEAARYRRLVVRVGDLLSRYGYRELRTPVLERTELFVRTIGEVTDIVEKEMYTFRDELNGESLTLRPEGTAACVRAAIEHNLLYGTPQRLWYEGPMFRHERPQKGRYRQFHQVGVEAIGFSGPDIDAEQILLCARLWRELGLTDVALELNSLGDAATRAAHRVRLVEYFESHRASLDEDSLRRLGSNPLRILDTKNPALQAIVAGAPRLIDMLDAESAEHFAGVCSRLNDAGIAFTVNPRLVRGLDYYNRTVFEWVTTRLGAQGTICAGGRYDGLVEQLGGRAAPACGFAMGIERILALIEGGDALGGETSPAAYIVHQGAGEGTARFAVAAAEQLRGLGHAVIVHCGGGKFASQMKRADASGARYALIVGEAELEAGKLGVKPLRIAGEQALLAVEDVATLLAAAAQQSN